MSYVDNVYENVVSYYPDQKEYHQAVKEFLESVRTVVENDEEKYQQEAMLERMVVPDREHSFRVTWTDDHGEVQVNHGYRIQVNNALGPYKGGLRFHPTVTQGMIKFLGFEMVYKNALTGLPIGGAKGGADFDPKGKSDREIMRFCQAYVGELFKYTGPNMDVPAGDIGVGGREIGYLFGMYKKLTDQFDGTLTGKGLTFGGSLVRTEATGYGLMYFVDELLKDHGQDIKGKTVTVSGAGHVAIFAIEKAQQMGAKVVTCSDSNGWVYDPDGIDLDLLKEVKLEKRARLTEYAAKRPNAEYHEGHEGLWAVKTDIALPCATQNDITLEDAKALVANGTYAVCEGANMPTTLEATDYLQKNGVILCPSKACNAGGVSVSELEMAQDSEHLYWSFEEVDSRLSDIMRNIYHIIADAAKENDLGENYVAGANIAAFNRVAEAMAAQGVY